MHCSNLVTVKPLSIIGAGQIHFFTLPYCIFNQGQCIWSDSSVRGQTVLLKNVLSAGARLIMLEKKILIPLLQSEC